MTVSPRLRMLAARYVLGQTRQGLSRPEVVVELLWYLAAFTLVGFLASLLLLEGPIQVLIGAALASIVIAAKMAEAKLRAPVSNQIKRHSGEGDQGKEGAP